MRLHLSIVRGVLAISVSSAVAAEAPVQTLRGTRVPCEIDVPSSWRVRSNENAVAAIGDDMQILLSSGPQVGDSQAAAKVACDGARQLMPDAKWTEFQPIKLAGHDWLEFTITGTLENRAMTFLNYTYSGPAGTVTIIGQVMTERLAEKREDLVRYMNTFRFAAVDPAAPNAGR